MSTKLKKTKGLGRGLEALLGSTKEDEPQRSDSNLTTLAVDKLISGKYQPRTRMDAGSLEELAASIRTQGVMQPILVRPIGKERYEIIAGERRWRASQIAELNEVPVIIREIPDEAALAMALIENIQREDLNPLEEAVGIQRLINEFGMTHQQAADAVGRSRPATSNLLRLIQLPKPVQELLMAGDIEMGHARALLPLKNADQITFANLIVAKRLSVRETERLVNAHLNPKENGLKAKFPPSRDVVRLEEELSDTIGATVKIQANRKGAGKVSIQFGSLDQLDGILGYFGKPA